MEKLQSIGTGGEKEQTPVDLLVRTFRRRLMLHQGAMDGVLPLILSPELPAGTRTSLIGFILHTSEKMATAKGALLFGGGVKLVDRITSEVDATRSQWPKTGVQNS